jgi:RNA polymerase sigma-70 factor (ECF subfamily)
MRPRRNDERNGWPKNGAPVPAPTGDGALTDRALTDRALTDRALTDEALIDRALAGQGEAFGVLVTRYQDRLYNTLVHVTGSADEAREITQEAFVQAFVKLATFRRSAAFYTWLFRIAINLRIGRKRRERRHRIWEEGQVSAGIGMGAGQDPSTPLESAERAAHVRAAIALLADDHRTVLLLREMEGCCYEEISRILDVPLGTVRSRLHRARAHLREELRAVHQQELK